MSRYRLERRIGEGGMAEVFRARSEGTEGFARICAVKRLLPDLAANERLQQRFIDEALIQGRLHHPCIVHVFDFYVDAGVHHIAMEFVDGVSAEHLVQKGFAGRFIPPAITARIVFETARAIEYAHRESVVHRDISACNILVSREGEVKLADFGLADAREKLSHTLPGELTGKGLYLSPERKAGAPGNTLDDLYALGIVLERLLDAADPRQRSTSDGERLRAIQEELLASPEKRLPSASALLERLRTVTLAGPELVGELVQKNPAPKSSASRPKITAEELDDTTERSQPGASEAEEPTVFATAPGLRAAMLGAVAAVLILLLAAWLAAG